MKDQSIHHLMVEINYINDDNDDNHDNDDSCYDKYFIVDR